MPKDVNVESGDKGKDYYDRIRDVIDRIIQRRNLDEARVAELFLSDIEVLEELEELEIVPRRNETRHRTVSGIKFPPRSGYPKPIDVSWKYTGSAYNRKSSRVGEEFNATLIPAAGTFKSVENGQESEELKLCELTFDYRRAQVRGILPYIQNTVPYNKKEAAVACAAKHDYDLEKIEKEVGSSKVHDGSDWTVNEKEEFKKVIYSHKKDVVVTAKTMNKSINDVFTYYLGSFKKSDDYRLLKVICEEARAEKNASSEHGLDACGYCGDGGSLLICDGCEGEYHMACMMPRLATIPEGHWECDDCVNRKFLAIRDNLIQTSRLFVRIDSGDFTKRNAEEGVEKVFDPKLPDAKKLKTEQGSTQPLTNSAGGIMLRPSSPAIASVRKLAGCISQALSV